MSGPVIRLPVFLRARRVKLLVSVRKVECRTFKSYLSVCVCVCLSVNNAARCSLPVSIKRTHVIGLKSTNGEYDHISKGCRVACVYSGLIWTLTASYSFFSDCCCWIVFNNLIQFYELDYLYQRASSRACSPILSCKGVTI
uniref:Uncharacterized protein n=1 Tax=Hyaloperonospora arabidopsidis (strain Emoy2) TaxID=559515 RepID=M4BVD5_HYAAE